MVDTLLLTSLNQASMNTVMCLKALFVDIMQKNYFTKQSLKKIAGNNPFKVCDVTLCRVAYTPTNIYDNHMYNLNYLYVKIDVYTILQVCQMVTEYPILYTAYYITCM